MFPLSSLQPLERWRLQDPQNRGWTMRHDKHGLVLRLKEFGVLPRRFLDGRINIQLKYTIEKAAERLVEQFESEKVLV